MLAFAASYHLQRLWGVKPWTRHGLVLMVGGIAFIFIGISYIYAEPNMSREVALQFALEPLGLHVPLSAWGYWFAITGVITAISSRWPPVSRTWGYTLLTGLSTAWGLFYLAGVLFGDSPLTNISGAILWSVFGFMWWAISGLKDPVTSDGQR